MPAPNQLPVSGSEYSEALVRGAGLLAENGYPGRVAIMGLSSDGKQLLQAYALGGRSPGSKNRILRQEADYAVRAVDPTMSEAEIQEGGDALRHYVAMAASVDKGLYVVSNGAQTEPVRDALFDGVRLDVAVEAAPTVKGVFNGKEIDIDLSSFEPDEPINTPRITGVIDLREHATTPFGFAVVSKGEDGEPVRNYYGAKLEDLHKGEGWGVQTYGSNDPNDRETPVPSFSGLPYRVEMQGDATEVAWHLQQTIGRATFAACAVRAIDLETGKPAGVTVIGTVG